jgi:septum formation protein
VEATKVTFGTLTDDEIAAYVATGSPMDKAGSYGIQDDLGALFVERIDGDYYNVVGLPLRRLYLTLRGHFSDFVGL